MKKIINSIGICVLLFAVSCSEKEPCEYETSATNPPSSCVENEFAGYMVFTQGSGSTGTDDFGLIFNTQNTFNAPLGQNWYDPSLGTSQLTAIHPAMWKKSVIGNVFGIALDDSNGIYLSASNIYFGLGYGAGDGSAGVYGIGGSAGIYYTNMSNPNVTSTLVKTLNSASANTVGTATIPSTGNSSFLGNVAYDKMNNQLFATNGEDGRIYRINPTNGIVKSIFDPFVLDNGVAGRVLFGEQIWGIRTLVENGITYVYFARSVSYNANSQVGVKEIWSIQLDSNGEFMATEIGATKLFDDSASSSVLQIANVRGTRPFIMDIAFSSTGKRMMVAERGNPHNSQTFEYVRNGATWIVGNNFYSGGEAIPGQAGQNAAGGVDYGNRRTSATSLACDDIVWTTSNFMRPLNGNSDGLYGIQGISAAGNSATVLNNNTTDLYIDYNNDTSTSDKGGIGDVEIFDSKCPCNN
ncbi:hypothetical protein [Flavobacterium sp.]|uniref:hypothetical protein n=1 Tax=Flavobacterium sp. TaxID=239 RepID=UPI000EDB32CA|nr:hypothetical protein [Flavobacterium sp.]HCQ12324.1 hypothetical protein [Flavobacterium sp.]